MNILICGAHGFIGRHLACALEADGHIVIRGVRGPAQAAGQVPMDFTRDTEVTDWLPRLAGVEAVINTIGVLRQGPRTPMQAIHAEAPSALFDACVRQGVKRVIHMSALGIAGNASPYARTKCAAEAHLHRLTAQGALQGMVLQPSIVFGPGGAGSALFTALARWPTLVLPRQALQAQVQPVWVRELAEVTVHLMGPASGVCGTLACVGPQGTPLAGLIASLRSQRSHSPAWVVALPDLLTRASARLGDAIPITPWGTQALALLAQDNTADPQPFAELLGRQATHYRHLLACLSV